MPTLEEERYGPITGPEAKYTNLPVRRFRQGWKNITLKPPPKNDSLQTWLELQQIKELLRKLSPEDEKDIERQDTNIEREFTSLLPEGDQQTVLQDLDNLTDELTTICQYFKLQFDRPRPEQLLRLRNVKATVLPSKTASTPAYPSGHATLSRFVALYLSDKYPALRASFEETAKEIGYNRVRAGLHFPSDYEAGVRLADELWTHFKG